MSVFEQITSEKQYNPLEYSFVTPEGVKVEYKFVTPELAEYYLSKNTRNRKPTAANTTKIVHDLINGDFLFTGDAIRFGTDGVMLDAQHRCLAAVESGVGFYSLVITNLDVMVQDVIDGGVKRSISNRFELHNHVNTSSLAASLRAWAVWSSGAWRSGAVKWSDKEVMDQLDNLPNFEYAVSRATQIYKKSGLTKTSSAILFYRFNAIDSEACEEFFHKVCTGADLSENDPILHLRNYLSKINERKYKNNRSVMWQQIMPAVIKTWNLFRDGVTETKGLRISVSSESRPEKFPEPH